MRSVSIVGIGQLPSVPSDPHLDEAGMVQAAVAAALQDAGIPKDDVGFYCSGSSDYIMGRPFSFATAVDGLGMWPPKRESHVEMDGAWALYEAWVRLQHGDVDVAVAYAYTKGHQTDVDEVGALQLDPYAVSPLRLDPMSIAGMQARALFESGEATADELAEVAIRSYRDGVANPRVVGLQPIDAAAYAASETVASPLRVLDGPRRVDGCAAVVLQVSGEGPRVDGFAHITDSHHLGLRNLADSISLRTAAERAGATRLDAVELATTTTVHELIARRALQLGDGVVVNGSGGALVADAPFVTGLTRICEAVRQVRDGANRVLAHATTGPALQHNLVAVLERT